MRASWAWLAILICGSAHAERLAQCDDLVGTWVNQRFEYSLCAHRPIERFRTRIGHYDQRPSSQLTAVRHRLQEKGRADSAPLPLGPDPQVGQVPLAIRERLGRYESRHTYSGLAHRIPVCLDRGRCRLQIVSPEQEPLDRIAATRLRCPGDPCHRLGIGGPRQAEGEVPDGRTTEARSNGRPTHEPLLTVQPAHDGVRKRLC